MTTAEDWQGRVGQEWAKRTDALDALLGPAGDEGLRRLCIAPGQVVLDLGCGAGTTSFALANRGARVTAVDISPDLLEAAQARNSNAHVTWVLGDAATIRYPQKLEGLYSRCGAMFFDQPMVAFAHLRAQMRAEAPLCIVCWRDAEQNAWARTPLEIARPTLGSELTALPRPGGQGPFGWARAETFIDILRGTGWRELAHDAFDVSAPIGAGLADDPVEAAVQFCMRIGPLASKLRGVPPSLRTLVADALREQLAPYQVDEGPVMLGTAAWIITARA